MANVAVELFFARVRDNVPHQMLLSAERFVAVRLAALERTQAQVQLQVLRQVLFALEHLVAFVARGHIRLVRAGRRCVDRHQRGGGRGGGHGCCRFVAVALLHFDHGRFVDGRFGDDRRFCGRERSGDWLALWRCDGLRHRRCGCRRNIGQRRQLEYLRLGIGLSLGIYSERLRLVTLDFDALECDGGRFGHGQCDGRRQTLQQINNEKDSHAHALKVLGQIQ